VCLDSREWRFDHPIKVLQGVCFVFEVPPRESAIVVNGKGLGPGRDRFCRQFDRLIRAALLPPCLAEHGEQEMLIRLLFESQPQFAFSLAYAAEVQIDFGDIEAGQNLRGIKVSGLLEFGFRLGHELRCAFGEIRLS